MLLDYVAASRIELEEVAELVEGAAEVCRAAGVALVGGETAELPGIYREGELDFAGTCVGVVDRDAVVDGARSHARRRGHRPRLGRHPRERLHARPRARRRRGLRRRAAARAARGSTSTRCARSAQPPTRRRSRTSPAAASPATSDASSPTASTPSIDWDAWERPPVFGWLAERGVAEDELRRVFNLGIGWCAVVPEAPAGATVIGGIT